jgi:hypothetical protein
MKNDRNMVEGNATATERRNCSRFRLTGDAWFHWQAAGGDQGLGEGETRDVCKGGAFIESNNVPPVDTQIKLVVTLRGQEKDSMTVCLFRSGAVRHVRNKDGTVVGFGAAVLFHTEAQRE